MDSGVATGFSRAPRAHRFHWPRGNAKWAMGRVEKTKRGAQRARGICARLADSAETHATLILIIT